MKLAGVGGGVIVGGRSQTGTNKCKIEAFILDCYKSSWPRFVRIV
jgi:hypothetical protein